ncbi:hypothetical protein ACLQ2R_29670 [Streptosporangium sp. DT93]|uniref:hypothetical protein n=1 Tax=Streptosporangium sp. DT93 TaxID=3393428 RepID=UPI003CEF3D92
MTKPRKPGPVGCLVLAYCGLVLILGLSSIVILLTAQDPILLTGAALLYLTFPLGWLVLQGWDLLLAGAASPTLFILLLMAAGFLQAWAVTRLARWWSARRRGGSA